MNFNPRTPCGVRLLASSLVIVLFKISIHAPLAGCDDPGVFGVCAAVAISIHAPLAGCDRLIIRPGRYHHLYFNPRTPCGVRPIAAPRMASSAHFNPRTPCGVRLAQVLVIGDMCEFQSTHPLRGATVNARRIAAHRRHFNPRTPCGVRHVHIHRGQQVHYDFNPRTPCGVRLSSDVLSDSRLPFQSTHPLRGATMGNAEHSTAKLFQSTHPLRGATEVSRLGRPGKAISIHAPLAGCDLTPSSGDAQQIISIHAPLAGCDGRSARRDPAFAISIHAPLAGCDRALLHGVAYGY